jgi:putative ABC transport system permease protein
MALWHDVRLAVRLLAKGRWMTLAALVALALGMGANIAVFTIFNAVLLRDLPFRDPDAIVSFFTQDDRGRRAGSISYPDFRDYRTAATSFSNVAATLGTQFNTSDDDHIPEIYQGAYVSVDFFTILEQHAVLGRDFRPDDDVPGAPGAALISDMVWRTRYGADRNVIGKPVRLNSVAATIVGVMPPGFSFQNRHIWLPEGQVLQNIPERARSFRAWGMMGRLRDGVSLEQARSELASIGGRLAADYPGNKGLTASVDRYGDTMRPGGSLKTTFNALMGAVLFVLLIACANVANLLLTRAVDRTKEIGVRFSLGASRWRIVRQLLVESLLLATAAGALGLAVAIVSLRAFQAAVPAPVLASLPPLTWDPLVAGFIVATCLGTGIVFGIAPALQLSRSSVNEVLKESSRGGTGGVRTRRWTAGLVVVELALTFILLGGAGLMMRTALILYQQDAGFDTSRLLTGQLSLPSRVYNTPEDRARFLQRVDDHLSTVAEFQGGTTASSLPMTGGGRRRLEIEGQANAAPVSPLVVSITPRYFDALGVRVVRGRALDALDGAPGRENILIDRRFAETHFRGEDPIGRRIRLTTGDARVSRQPWLTIVGIAPDIAQQRIGNAEPAPAVYMPHVLNPSRFATVFVRTRRDPADGALAFRQAIQAVDPNMAVYDIRTFDDVMSTTRWQQRVFGAMFAIFALLAILLSAIGLYAITAYSVTQRTREIGIRMALGAESRQVRWLFIRSGVLQVAIGLALGIAGAFATGKLLQGLLVRTSTTDPVALGSTAVVLIVVALAACFFPARRATRLNPLVALRYE